jgi:hypothetical protein
MSAVFPVIKEIWAVIDRPDRKLGASKNIFPTRGGGGTGWLRDGSIPLRFLGVSQLSCVQTKSKKKLRQFYAY